MKTSLVSIVFFFVCLHSFACNCFPSGSVAENVSKSDYVIKAKVLSFSYTNKLDTLGVKLIGDHRNTFARYWSFNVKVYKVLVLKTYKGFLNSDTVSVVTGVNRAACSSDFDLGGNYIIYGFEKDYMGFSNVQRMSTNSKLFWTNNCTRSDYFTNEEEKNLLLVFGKD